MTGAFIESPQNDNQNVNTNKEVDTESATNPSGRRLIKIIIGGAIGVAVIGLIVGLVVGLGGSDDQPDVDDSPSVPNMPDLPKPPTGKGWGEWSEWTDCSQSCGVGQSSRMRLCDGGADACPGYPESALELKECNVKKCLTGQQVVTDTAAMLRTNLGVEDYLFLNRYAQESFMNDHLLRHMKCRIGKSLQKHKKVRHIKRRSYQ